jgi:hypothetical protein
VIVTRDTSGQPIKIEWFETEHQAYVGDPMLVHEFNPSSNVWWSASLRNTLDYKQLIAPLVVRLTENPFANVDEFETHRWPEPGAPLEPVVPALARSVGCDLTPLCPAVRHVSACLGLYRTEDEVAREFVPEVSVLAQRRADERFHRAYVRAGGPS